MICCFISSLLPPLAYGSALLFSPLCFVFFSVCPLPCAISSSRYYLSILDSSHSIVCPTRMFAPITSCLRSSLRKPECEICAHAAYSTATKTSQPYKKQIHEEAGTLAFRPSASHIHFTLLLNSLPLCYTPTKLPYIHTQTSTTIPSPT